MKACTNYCTEFYNSCKNEYICFNKEGLQEYFMDYLTDHNLSEEKDYKIFHCEGNYECKKIEDSLIAKPLGKILFSSVTSTK